MGMSVMEHAKGAMAVTPLTFKLLPTARPWFPNYLQMMPAVSS